MKDKIKTLINILFGTSQSIKSRFGISCFFTGLYLSLFTFMFNTNSREKTFLIYASSICFFLWILIMQGAKKAEEIIIGLARALVALLFLSYSLSISLKLKTYNSLSFYYHAIIMTILLLICTYYLITKVSSFLSFIRTLFFQIKEKLFPNKTENKFKTTVENITVFLVSLSGLIIAVGAIINAIMQLFDTITK